MSVTAIWAAGLEYGGTNFPAIRRWGWEMGPVAWLHELEQHLQFGSPVAAGTSDLLGANDTAAGRFESRTLDRKILIVSADACVTARGHFVPNGSRPRNTTVRE